MTWHTVGLGDALAWLFSHLGIHKWENCGCEERQAWLNQHFRIPYVR